MFEDRIEAGRLLAEKLFQELREISSEKLVVLSIPRGGVVVGNEVAKKLACRHDVVVTKKLRAPHQEELAIGAIGETKSSLYLDERLAADVRADEEYVRQEVKNRQGEVKRRRQRYRQGRDAVNLTDKVVVIVDDGIATGATMIAAVREVKSKKSGKVIIATPVCAQDSLDKLKKEADKVIVLKVEKMFYAVGQFYKNFPQVEDEEVINILTKS